MKVLSKASDYLETQNVVAYLSYLHRRLSLDELCSSDSLLHGLCPLTSTRGFVTEPSWGQPTKTPCTGNKAKVGLC